MDAFWEREIAANRIPGAVMAIAREGQLVYHKAFGYLDKASGERMPLEAMFNIASMTKPMTAVAALTLNEEGRLPIKSRLESYVPAFGKVKVGVVSGDRIDEQALERPIFIHDLYRHTSGLPYGGRGETPVHRFYPGNSSIAAAQYTGEEFLAKLASAPLLHQPATVGNTASRSMSWASLRRR